MARKKLTVDDEAQNLVEEAREDLVDAEDLIRRGGSAMAMYHAAQSAQKFLSAFGHATGHEMMLTWDLSRAFDTVKGEKGLDDIMDDVAVLAESSTPKKAGATREASLVAMRSARRVERAVCLLLGLEAPPEVVEPPAPVVAPAPAVEASVVDAPAADAPMADAPDAGNVDQSNRSGTVGRGRDLPEGRSHRDRETSYVKTFLICRHCGVRLPRTRQTARGVVPCPHCSRPMTLAQ